MTIFIGKRERYKIIEEKSIREEKRLKKKKK